MEYVSLNDMGIATINYYDTKAMSVLNEAIMNHYYNITDFKLDLSVMQPFLGGRVNYLEWLKELVDSIYPNQKDILLVDMGTGNSAIYLLLA